MTFTYSMFAAGGNNDAKHISSSGSRMTHPVGINSERCVQEHFKCTAQLIDFILRSMF